MSSCRTVFRGSPCRAGGRWRPGVPDNEHGSRLLLVEDSALRRAVLGLVLSGGPDPGGRRQRYGRKAGVARPADLTIALA
jgi:hypothetical protein